MFDALEVSHLVAERLFPIETRIRRKSASLGKQLSDAGESITLNLAESSGRYHGDKRRHWEMAHGSACEVTNALRLAVTKQYITAEERAHVEEVLDRVRAMLWRLLHPRR